MGVQLWTKTRIFKGISYESFIEKKKMNTKKTFSSIFIKLWKLLKICTLPNYGTPNMYLQNMYLEFLHIENLSVSPVSIKIPLWCPMKWWKLSLILILVGSYIEIVSWWKHCSQAETYRQPVASFLSKWAMLFNFWRE